MLDADIKSYKAAEVSAASTNGGRMSANLITSGVVNNVWPHVSKAQRLAGQTLYRKIFVKAADDSDGTFTSAQHWLDQPTDGDDSIVAFEGTQSDTQADVDGTERKYGCALVKTNITAGAQTFTVTVEAVALVSGNDQIFQDGDTIRLTDMATPDAGTGNEEFLTIDGAPSVSGLDVTLTVDEVIANNFLTANDARVSTVIAVGDVECSIDTFVDTAAGSGAYDDTTYPITTDNIGTVEDAVTVTFTDATSYTVTGTAGIAYGSGTTSGDFAPNNADFTKPYFTLLAAGFSGTWAAGDTITFNIHPASYSYWMRRIVPAASTSLANNKITGVTDGESA